MPKVDISKDPVYTDIKDYILKTMGGDTVSVELSDSEIETIVSKTLRKLTPYVRCHRYIQVNHPSKSVDLTAYNIIRVNNVYQTQVGADESIQDIFQPNGLMVFNADYQTTVLEYYMYQFQFNSMRQVSPQEYRYIKPHLLLYKYDTPVIVDGLTNPTIPSDITPDSQWYDWMFDYSLAQAKRIVGTKRNKFVVDSSPFSLDGQRLLDEAAAEMNGLEERLIFPQEIY